MPAGRSRSMVLHLVKTVHGATWALRQIRELSLARVEVTVALPSAHEGLATRYRDCGARIIEADLDFTARHPWRLARAVRRCREIVAEVRPAVIHSHFVSTTLVARLALRRCHHIPRVFQVPGPLHLEHAAFRRLDLATSGASDSWIGSCRWTCNAYRRLGVPSERVFLSYYGTDVDTLGRGERGEFRQQLQLPRDVPLVGLVAHMYAPKRFLGRTRGVKGHEDFIDAFRIVQRKHPDAFAVVVGGPWNGATTYEQSLRKRARAACGDRIVFTGHRTDIPGVYADLDIAVHPSLSENCGGAVESLAAGVPTIATAVGGLPDVVISGETGWLVPPRSHRDLAGAVLEALANPNEARRRANSGRDLVRRLFDVRRTGAEIAAIYGRILGMRGIPAVATTAV
jgi:glycosyltransferase involved in cell wall biosynthesis